MHKQGKIELLKTTKPILTEKEVNVREDEQIRASIGIKAHSDEDCGGCDENQEQNRTSMCIKAHFHYKQGESNP